MNLCDIKTVKQVMGMFHLTFRKEFGQNFLTDRSVVEDIADACCQDANSTILEIGPGMGTLTYELALRHKSVVALEIDRGLIPVLDYTLGEFDNVTVHNEDVMQADLEALLAPAFEDGPVSVCANLPYYITSPILMKLLECGLPFDYITVMIQKEVADRLCSPAGGKDYGAITAVLSYYGEAEKLFVVPADKFIPAPKVDSAVIRIRLYKERPYHPKDEALMFRTIKAAFAQRRKTLSNALSAGFSELTKDQINAVIADCGFEPTVRGERLDIAEFIQLSDKIGELLA
ncbi:MAG: 16S rRNA (adenine(1518)-N(6)/adenine(1519)-N(6))-dimethyltransferase RsmA [Ruminococcaceae bacterium]|nr:16S rRNA (adenine(1518)-N(6)/adenine(1519)-N(6))-dimethyltransferase RsmA [Oscillospiraceae bacterium]